MSWHSLKGLLAKKLGPALGLISNKFIQLSVLPLVYRTLFSLNMMLNVFIDAARLPQTAAGHATDFQDDKVLMSNGPDPLAYVSE